MILIVGIILAIVVFTLWLWWNNKSISAFVVALVSATVFSVVAIPTYMSARSMQGGDVMVLNGSVTSKAQVATSCSHSYSCNCRMVQSGKTQSMQCDTCYEHSHDYDWVVKSTVGKTYIHRVDRQGVREPERFKNVVIGEPFSIQRDYFNYIRASPLSVFKDYNAYENVAIPTYPKVYDYYRVKHTINWKSQYVAGIQNIDRILADKLKHSSAKAKANVVVIFYGGSDDLIEATKVKNFGGRINDLTVMIRADKDGTIQRVGVFSWSKNDMVNVMVRDNILELGQLNDENNEKLVDILNTTLLKYYQHRDNEEFSYLEHNIVLPTWVYIVYFVMISLVVGLNIFFRKEL